MKIPKVSIVVVTYKTCQLLKEFILSLNEDSSNKDLIRNIIVVDNNSQDGTQEMIEKEFPEVIFISNRQNLGPAKAFNIGIRVAFHNKSEFVIVANSDIKVIKGTVSSMFDYLQSNPYVDGVCGSLLNPDLTKQSQRTHVISLKKYDFSQEFKLDWIGNFFSLIRMNCFEKIGLYDENYYFYNEDLDWIERAKRAKMTFMYIPTAPIIHYGGQGKKHNVSAIVSDYPRANIYYYRKFYNNLIWLFYVGMLGEINYKIVSIKLKIVSKKEQSDWDRMLEIYYRSLKLMKEEMRKPRPYIGIEPRL